jgi:PAS domain S-box-containing protein
MQHNPRNNHFKDTRMYQFCSSEELYKKFFEECHSIMLIIAPKTGHIIDANEKACLFYGYSRDEITNMRIVDINCLSEEELFEEMEKAKLEKRNYFNFRHQLANGEIRYVEVMSGPISLNEDKLLYSIINDVSERKNYEHEREQLIRRLENALDEIKTLRGLIPICSYCKKIRDDNGYWNQIESYITEHTEAKFTHGICDQCCTKEKEKIAKHHLPDQTE